MKQINSNFFYRSSSDWRLGITVYLASFKAGDTVKINDTNWVHTALIYGINSETGNTYQVDYLGNPKLTVSSDNAAKYKGYVIMAIRNTGDTPSWAAIKTNGYIGETYRTTLHRSGSSDWYVTITMYMAEMKEGNTVEMADSNWMHTALIYGLY